MQKKNLNNTRYDDPRKIMKQTSFKVKNLGEQSQEEQFTIKQKFTIKNI